MATNKFETFCKAVAEYWPRCKTTEEQLRVHWDNCVCYHKPGVVTAALTKSVTEFPDDTAPKWKIILGYLAERSRRKGSGTGKSDFDVLLDDSREASKRDHVPCSGNMSDEDAWLRWLRVLTQSIKYSSNTRRCLICSRRPRGDCGLSNKECQTKRKIENETSHWRQYLADHAELIPEFLTDDYGDTPAFVEPKQPNGTLF